jgi:hypothetical protein
MQETGQSKHWTMSKVEGIQDAIKMIKEMEIATSRKIVIMSLRKASRPLVSSMKGLAPLAENRVREWWGKRLTIEPGTLKRSIRSIAPKAKRENKIELLVGPTKAKAGARRKMTETGSNKNDGWFRHFVIRGTAGYTYKKGKNKGRYIPGQSANPFVDKAYSQTASKVSGELEKEIVSNINKVINK